MSRIVIYGNSGAGKSTLAKKFSKNDNLSHLDLDTLAWKESQPPERRNIHESATEIESFLESNSNWVIEGCYADLLELVVAQSTQLIFLNPGIDACTQNCRQRPWEAHKYPSKEEQDKNLELLLGWVKQYESRGDEFSLQAHQTLFDRFKGDKACYLSLDEYR